MQDSSHSNNWWSQVFSADVLEFINMSIRFCQLVEEPSDADHFALDLQKVCSVLYGKVLSFPEMNEQEDTGLEQYVTEDQYNEVRSRVASLLGSHDDYLDVFVEDMKYSDRPILRTISEDVADIYQSLADFLFCYRTGSDEIRYLALFRVVGQYREYWGGRCLSAMRALHDMLFLSPDSTDEEW
ncbi:MAG: DUF5063 domain-containing protein [Prevotellaceae bacterium]|nr:DUF5063 domain-containing protein [Prevotellaceae bacterium]MDY3294951.1 DUF5063 domain-containing protein [Bacteroidaceae bacterium]